VTLIDADPDRYENALRDQEERRSDAEGEGVGSLRLVRHGAAVVTRDAVPVCRWLRRRRFVAELKLVADSGQKSLRPFFKNKLECSHETSAFSQV
jgi:hypothetical protein